MRGEVVRSRKVEGRFIIHENAIVLIPLNRAVEEPCSYHAYGKYTLDASTFTMGFDDHPD
jgi:hypothetical protein